MANDFNHEIAGSQEAVDQATVADAATGGGTGVASNAAPIHSVTGPFKAIYNPTNASVELDFKVKKMDGEPVNTKGGSARRRSSRRRGGTGALGRFIVPFSLIALQQVIGEKQNQEKLHRIDRSLGSPGTSVIKGAVNVGTGVIRTGLGAVQSVLPGRKSKRKGTRKGTKKKRRTRR